MISEHLKLCAIFLIFFSRCITSIPSRFMTVGSIFNIAALMDRGGGNFVIPILIAFDRFGSNTITSFVLLISCCF